MFIMISFITGGERRDRPLGIRRLIFIMISFITGGERRDCPLGIRRLLTRAQRRDARQPVQPRARRRAGDPHLIHT